MVKGEDAIRKKKNKATRKRMNRKETVSSRIAAIIASKKRRMSGKRRMCEGMCFTLPTPEDPFNEKSGKRDFKRKNDTKKLNPSSSDDDEDSTMGKRKGDKERNCVKVDNGEKKRKSITDLGSVLKKVLTSAEEAERKIPDESKKLKVKHVGNGELERASGRQTCEVRAHAYESKFLFHCLTTIENALCLNGTLDGEEGEPFVASTWGIEFLESYLAGKDILESSGSCPAIEQIAWMVSTAADAITKKEKEGLIFAGPFLLYLVPNQEKAAKVRAVCKPLKALGIHTVSLHSGATIDHQIHGLRSCEPEFLVSTPERLLELVSLKAIDLSGVSLLVIDGLNAGGQLETIKSFRNSIPGNPITVVCSDHLNIISMPEVKSLLMGSIHRLSLNDSVASQSACISQSIHVCLSKDEKISEGIQILDEACDNHICPKVLVVGKKSRELFTALRSGGYYVSKLPTTHNTELGKGKWKASVFVTDMEHIRNINLGNYEVVMILDISSSVDNYVHILARMARHTIQGVLHSFLTAEDSSLTRPLIDILEQCGQTIPEALKDLRGTLAMSEQ